MGKRIHLFEYKTDSLAEDLNGLESVVDVPKNTAQQKNQTLDALTSEEVLLLAMFLRSERQTWIPRIVLSSILSYSIMLSISE